MKINTFEILNLIIALFFILLIKRQRDATTLLIILFFYGSLHFSFGSVALITKDSASLLIALHNEGGGMLAKLSALLLLGIVFILLSRQAFNLCSDKLKNSILLSPISLQRSALWIQARVVWVVKHWDACATKVEIHLLLVMATVYCGYFLKIRFGDWLQLKNVISIEIMLVLVMIGYIALTGVRTYNAKLTYSWVMRGLFILFFSDCIAFYEVLAHQSWAGTLESSGGMVYRASSILFNPNLFGFWASLVYLGCAYGMHAYMKHWKMMLLGMVLAAIGIYLSGSRSACYLLLGVLFIPLLLIRERFNWLPLIALPLIMLAIYGVAWLVTAFISSSGGVEIALLGERFAATPLNLINYVLSLIDIPARVSVEVVQSIEGRFTGGLMDAGWLVLYQDVGKLGMGAVIWSCSMLIAWGIRVYISHPSSTSVYALTALCYCLLIGFSMRFQIFPVWLFISTVIVACLAFWRQLPLPAVRIRS